AAGIAFDAAGQRIARLDEALPIIKALLAGTPVHATSGSYAINGLDLDVLPTPRSSPRLLVGAGGPRMLRLAARHADIVGVLPAPIRGSTDGDDPQDRLPAAFEAKIGIVRDAAAERFANIELNAFATFVITDNRRAATDELIARRGWSGIDVEAVWSMPTIFIGSPDQIRADVQARRERFRLSYLVVGEDDMPKLV